MGTPEEGLFDLPNLKRRPEVMYVSAHLLARNEDGEYLLLRRSKECGRFVGHWELPGGLVEEGEALEEALCRQVQEAVGQRAMPRVLIGGGNGLLDEKEMGYVIFEGEIGEGELRLGSHHDEYRWVGVKDLIDSKKPIGIAELLHPHMRTPILSHCRTQERGPEKPEDPEEEEKKRLEALGQHLKGFAWAKEKFETLSKEIQADLKIIVAQTCPEAVVEGRVKKAASFGAKILRKSKYKDPLREMTDLCGVRVITHLKSEVDLVCQAIRERFLIDEANSGDTLERLDTSEFGYRSVHFVVQLDPKWHPDLAKNLFELKAEIQVRTILQHAWSAIGHDRLYKGGFDVPKYWSREGARIAAVLENLDDAFGRLVEGLDSYRSDFGAYLMPAEIEKRAKEAEEIMKEAAADVGLFEDSVRLAMASEKWEEVRETVRAFEGTHTHVLKVCLGSALLELYAQREASEEEFHEGKRLLRDVADEDPTNTECRLRLAECEKDPEPRLKLFEEAYAADPKDPEALSMFIREKILVERSVAFAPLLRPSLLEAIEQCRLHVLAKLDVPRAYMRMARFNLLLGREEEAYGAVAHAVRLAKGERAKVPGKKIAELIDLGLEECEALGVIDATELVDVECFRRFLLLARHVAEPSKDTIAAIRELATEESSSLSEGGSGRVAFVAGGCDPRLKSEVNAYAALLEAGFARYDGLLISGGTVQGISGLVGAMGKAHQGRVHTLGYLPVPLPDDGTCHEDMRYERIVRLKGREGFSAYEPLQAWLDVIAAGIDPGKVLLVGVDGGHIASLEYRIAWGLGAHVGIICGSGRAAGSMQRRREEGDFPGLSLLPEDSMTLLAFVQCRAPHSNHLSDAQRENLAEIVHARFLDEGRYANPDAAMQPWARLSAGFKSSNLQQVAFMGEILANEGLEIVPVTDPREAERVTHEQRQRMGELEHGRWTVERLAAGWRPGPRDPEEKCSPYLVPWADLTEEVQGYDLKAVARFPELLELSGLKIVRM